jgi:hypothetical protein
LLQPSSSRTAATPAAPTEYEVKAAYLFHFASFVEWPEQAFDDADGRIVIGVLGEDPFDDILEHAVVGKIALQRGFLIKRGSSLEELGRPHILFISSSERARLPRLLAALGDASVLTVGETHDFAKLGGMICFTLRDKRVRFEINLGMTKRARLRISSQLLKLATKVYAG